MDSTIEILQARGTNDLSISQIDDITTHRQYITLQNKFKDAIAELTQLKKTNFSINEELLKLKTDSTYT